MMDDQFYILNSRVLKLRDWIYRGELCYYESDPEDPDNRFVGLNSNIAAVKFLSDNPELIIWEVLSRNSEAIDLLLDNSGMIDMKEFCYNNSDKAVEFLENYLFHKNFALLARSVDKYKKYRKIVDTLDWFALSSNTSNKMYRLIYPDCLLDINWAKLSENKSEWAGKILEEYPEYINWSCLSANPADWAIRLLEENIVTSFSEINWYELSANSCEEAIELLLKFPNEIDFNMLSLNRAEGAIKLLQRNISKINWSLLSYNEFAIDLLLEYPDKIDFSCFIMNRMACSCDASKNILDKFLSKLDFDNGLWRELSMNIGCIELISKYRKNIDYTQLAYNPAIFEIDYDFIKSRCDVYYQELMSKALHPDRFTRYLLLGYDMGEEEWIDEE